MELSTAELEQGCVKVIVPVDPSIPDGPRLEASAVVESHSPARGVASIIRMDGTLEWTGERDVVYFEVTPKGESIALRLATDDDCRVCRAPIWIGEVEIPVCCGMPMYFVGQIDDDRIQYESPAWAKKWWTDSASFFVFTCSQCRNVSAAGQQFE